jgi:large subunit ribosomal protein L3
MPYQTGVLGKKIGMTQIFTQTGDRHPVTAIQAGPCVVLDKLTPEKNGYAAVKLGLGVKPLRLAKKPELGTYKKSGLAPQRFVREIRVEPAALEKFEIGQAVKLSDVFKPLTFVDVQGTSKGKGFQGVVKRHHMAAFVGSHGTHEFFRHGGSIGCRLTPGRVHKGKRMGGHMGDETTSVQNLVLMEIDDEQNVLLVRGAIPGARNGYVVVRNAKKKSGQQARLRSYTEQQEKSKNPMKASKAGAGSAKPKPGGGKK